MLARCKALAAALELALAMAIFPEADCGPYLADPQCLLHKPSISNSSNRCAVTLASRPLRE